MSIAWSLPPDGHVRANPCYELRPLTRMSKRARESLEFAGVDMAGVYGLLVPRHDRVLLPKVVDTSAAGLVMWFREGQRGPFEIGHRVPSLVLDGILEVEGTSGFVSGPTAFDEFADVSNDAPDRTPSSLGAAALEYAERLRLTSIDAVTARLYHFHRWPLSRRWRRAYPGAAAVKDLIPVGARRNWIERPASEHWISWVRRDRASNATDATDATISPSELPYTLPYMLPYKLYVSPTIDSLPSVLGPLVEALATTSATRFKLGATAAGLVRPDKFVVYLRDAAAVEEVAAALAETLSPARTHGVPFSAPMDDDGLLSWGGDPPPEAAPVGRRVESWRLSVCRRLAEGLVAAQAVPLRRVRPRDFALARLSADGVDVASFAPASLLPPRRLATRQPVPP